MVEVALLNSTIIEGKHLRFNRKGNDAEIYKLSLKLICWGYV